MQAPHNQKQKAQLRAPDPGNPQIGTEARPVVVELKDRPKSEAESAEDRRKNGNKEYLDRWTFYAAIASAVISGLLLMVGWCGVRAAVRTLKAIERQLALQEVAMTQWLNIEKWHGQLVTQQDEQKLEFSFDITNTTKFPLTLEYITTNAHGCAMTRRSDQVLAPDGASNVKGITGKLGDDQIRIYNTTKLTLVIEGAVVYENVFKKRQTQRFNAMCFGSAHSEFVFYSYAGAKESQEKAN